MLELLPERVRRWSVSYHEEDYVWFSFLEAEGEVTGCTNTSLLQLCSWYSRLLKTSSKLVSTSEPRSLVHLLSCCDFFMISISN